MLDDKRSLRSNVREELGLFRVVTGSVLFVKHFTPLKKQRRLHTETDMFTCSVLYKSMIRGGGGGGGGAHKCKHSR